ncbi:MAG: hypothetical protein ACJAZ0_000173 [Halioglobus sp.]|jgi:hypothetical protein
MKILLFGHLGQIPEYAGYIDALKKVDSVESLLLTMGDDEYELGQEVGVFDMVKTILPEQSELDIADGGLSTAAQSLKELEDHIGSNFVNQDILTDRWFLGQPRLDIDLSKLPLIWTGAKTKQFMCLIYERLKEEIESFDPDFVYLETSFAPTRMAWRLACLKGIPAGGFMPVRFWPERLYLETGIGYDWHQARTAYREMPGRPMAGEELSKVKQRLQTIRAEKVKPAYLKTEHAKGAAKFFKKLFATRTISGHGSWLGARARTSNINPWVLPREIYSPFAKYVRYRRGLKAKRYLLEHQTPFDKIRTKKYAIYFLHVQPEITVEGMAFDYQDQVSTLRNILASLPADTDLVVKEHSPMLGYRPLEFYIQLMHMPGLIFADAGEDSHQLITHAAVVVTLTGTVALEAVLYGIPAVVLGTIYFDDFNGVYKPDSINELKELLASPEKLQGATNEDSLRALGSLLRASKPGSPARVDVTAKQIDNESAKVMMLELANLGKTV